MKAINYKEKGITLVALVITIIILLILAGVTLNTALGENGLFKIAKKATESYQIASEREYIEQNVLAVQLDKYMGNVSSEKLGEILNTKSIENSSNWHIIKVNEKSYEKGWNYIEKGTELVGYGKAEHSWLVNYETGEVIQLEENNYIDLSAGDMLAVKDSLIINVDSSIIDENVGNNKASLEKQLGEGVTLEGFDYNDNSGLTSTSFNFDGINDYIRVQYDKQEQRQALAKNGFTFEFYGTWNDGTSYDDNHTILTDSGESSINDFKGIFCYWNGIEEEQAMMRFGIWKRPGTLGWNAGWVDVLSDFSSDKQHGAWNIQYPLEIEKLKEDTYITVTVDTSKLYKKENDDSNEEYYKQTMYINGEKKYEGGYNKKQWDYFIDEECLNHLKYFCLGRSSMHGGGWWHYSKMNAYCLRLYSRALSEDEVHKNYEKSVEYHSLLTK